MPAIKRLHTLFLAIELREAATTTGTYQNQTGKMLVIDPQLEFETPRYDRVPNQRSMTRLGGLAGIRAGRSTFGLELAGSVGPNQFQDALHCCGLANEPVSRFAIGAVTGGPFRHGETITQASSGASGLCVGDVWDTMPLLWVAQAFQFGSGTFDGTGTLVGSSSNAQATPSVYTSPAGRAWWPFSPRQSVVQFDGSGLLSAVTAGHVLRGVTSRAVAIVYYSQTAGVGQQVIVERQAGHFTGAEVVENVSTGNTNIGTTQTLGFEVSIRNGTASIGLVKDLIRERIDWARGNVKLAGSIGEPAVWSFEFKGAMRSVIDQGLSLHPDLSGILVPPVLLGVDLKLGLETSTQSQLKTRCIRSFTLDAGNDVQVQECMALTQDHGPFFGPPHDDFTPLGVEMAVIVGRKPTLTLDPYLDPETAFPWMTSYMNNQALRLQMTIGSAAPNKFYLSVPSMSISAAGSGDYNALSTRQITLELTGGNAPGPRGDNEWVLVQELQ